MVSFKSDSGIQWCDFNSKICENYSFMLTDSAESLLVMLEKHDDCGYKKPVPDCQQDTEYKPQTPVSE